MSRSFLKTNGLLNLFMHRRQVHSRLSAAIRPE
jgi:hypothetical protein